MIWPFIKGAAKILSALGVLVGILYLPSDIKGLPEALKPIQDLIGMYERGTYLVALCIVLIAYIAWIETRSFLFNKFRLLYYYLRNYLRRVKSRYPSIRVRIEGGTFNIIDSYNVESISDDGVGQFTVTFGKPLNMERMVVQISGLRNLEYAVAPQGDHAARVQFTDTGNLIRDGEPPIFLATFNDGSLD